MKLIVCDCSEIILKSADGVQKIRSRIMLVKGGSVYAVCKSCGTEVRVPLVVVDPVVPVIVK